jgi:hypothetical protein
MAAMTDLTTTIRDFLALPHEALPSAIVDGYVDNDVDTDPWSDLRAAARGRLPIYSPGEVVLLRADRDGWREGVRIRLPCLDQPGAVL